MNFVSLLSTTADLLSRNNTTTSGDDISSGLNKRIQKFYRGVSGMYRDLPVPLEVYPAVFVELSSVNNTIDRLGPTQKRDLEVLFDVITVTNYGAASSSEGYSRERANLECIKATQNITNLLRKKITLSGTVSFLESWGTEFSVNVAENYYNVVSKIGLKARIISTS